MMDKQFFHDYLERLDQAVHPTSEHLHIRKTCIAMIDHVLKDMYLKLVL